MFERIVVVTKKTPLEELLMRHYSRGQAKFFLERRGTSIEEYEAGHRAYREALETVLGALPRDLPREFVPRELVPNYLFREKDLVIAVGPDGLCVNVAKYLQGQPIFGVNPDRARIDGVLVRHSPKDVPRLLPKILRGEFQGDRITLGEIRTNDGQTLYAVNDFLIGRRDHVSARYTIGYRGMDERQSSSGILVSTGCGSTGWMSSLITGARAVVQADEPAIGTPFPWDQRQLLFAVREPFLSKYTKADVVFGLLEEGEELTVTSEMSEGGAIFSDGVIEDALEFNAGAIATVCVAEKFAILIRT